MNREKLKLRCLAQLDERATKHPAGHQGKLAARYLLRHSSGDVVAVMFEKGPDTPANLWVARRYVSNLILKPGVNFKLSLASKLYSTISKNGEPLYGRHSALRAMPELKHADLIRFRISTMVDLDQILDHLDGWSHPKNDSVRAAESAPGACLIFCAARGSF